MKCEEAKKILPAYQEGDLSSAKAAEMRAHLASCHSCQKEEQFLSASWDLLGTLRPIEPPPDFRARLWERVRVEEERQQTKLRPVRSYAYALGLVAIGVFGVGIGSYIFLRSPNVRPIDRPVTSASFPSSIEHVYLNRWKETRI